MEAARGESFRMRDQRRSPILQSEIPSSDVLALALDAPPHLALGPLSASAGALPPSSRQRLRGRHPGRDLRIPPLSRPIEELALERALAAYLPPGKMISLHLTDNHYTIISVRRGRDIYRLRAHRMFAGVGPRLVRALARYVVHNDQRASKLLGEHIERHEHLIADRPRRQRRLVLRTRGRHHDLSAIYDRLNRDYFSGAHDARISWGIARRPKGRRSIKAGSFSVEDRLIRIHPLLDHASVPGYFLDWIVFHEMLHGKHAIRTVAGRRCFHPPQFAEEERAFPDYDRARLWEKTHLDRLLGC